MQYDVGRALTDQGVCYYATARDERPVPQPYLPRCPFMGGNATLIGNPDLVQAGVSPFMFKWQSPSQVHGISMHVTTVGRPIEAGGHVIELPYADS